MAKGPNQLTLSSAGRASSSTCAWAGRAAVRASASAATRTGTRTNVRFIRLRLLCAVLWGRAPNNATEWRRKAARIASYFTHFSWVSGCKIPAKMRRMNRFQILLSGGVVVWLGVVMSGQTGPQTRVRATSEVSETSQTRVRPAGDVEGLNAAVKRYCVTCHSDKL